jgi:hypothetical protein
MRTEGISLRSIVSTADGAAGVRRNEVRDGDWLLVKTRNSVYTILIRTGGRCRVSGGWFDRRGKSPMETTVAGCTWGGSVIKVDLIAAVGLCIEFGNHLMTTEARRVVHFRRASLN